MVPDGSVSVDYLTGGKFRYTGDIAPSVYS